ncbi:xanthine dehydrogenase family protein molybdopterin-binding subunit, partial [Sciscionella sediminilitoris]|uniref:xanthine dehydrogenase family protein molybdopterin-binding subunit n=1 Tax=Sciscionella sediminilitoris TaxID=1445613 RepID=UPI0012E2D42C
SRSAMIGGSAVRLAADRLAERIRRIAAHLLEVTEEEIELDQGSARARGKAITLADLARLSHFQAHRLPKGVEFGLEVQAGFDVSGSGTFSNATHGVVVELDPETGAVRIPRYVVVEDCGTVLNPSIVDGQVRGGVAQGIGAALYERLHYEENGQPGVASLMDYLAPTAQEIPDIEIHHLETPCLFNETGAKGMGEGGTIGAPAAVLNAVNDALSHTGVRITEIPIRAETIRRALEGACTIRT